MARGFANFDKDAHRRASSRGGKTAHRLGVAHEWTSATAREAGRRGGQSTQARDRARREEAAERRSETTDVSSTGGK